MLKLSGMAVSSTALGALAQRAAPADYSIDIAPYDLEVAPRRSIKTVAYNAQVPGPLLRFKEGRPVTLEWRKALRSFQRVVMRVIGLRPAPPASAGITLIPLPVRICTRVSTPANTDF